MIAYEGYKVTIFLNISGSPTSVTAPTWVTGDQTGIDANEIYSGSWTRDGRTFNYGRNMNHTELLNYTTHVYMTCNSINSIYTGYNEYIINGYSNNGRTVSYNANGGTTTTQTTAYNPGWNVSLPTNTTTRSGYTFLGWSLEPDGNILTNCRMEESSKTLYAQWAKSNNL